ncbi:hypothetical protein BDV18DRAFT_5514 [Aspergillus unguis]
MAIPIVDSHIHLFAESHLPTLAWYTPDGPLTTQHSVDEYREATNEATCLRGFIFLEVDRISSVEQSGENKHGWTHALDEVSYLARIAAGTPVQGEGHKPSDKDLVLGIIPWAPVPGGPEVLEEYMALVRERTGPEVWSKIRGVRYLVQDKPSGTMLQPAFIEGLKWLGRKGLTFDLGVDARSGGIWQLEEAVELLGRVYGEVGEGERVKIVINHLCKPNLHLSPESTATSPDFLRWQTQVAAMAQHPATFMKLSGAFSEIPPDTPGSKPETASLVERIQPWTDAVFDAFGPERVMFGSDWPICNVGGGSQQTWGQWRRVAEGLLERRGLSEQQKRGFWGEVAVRAYGVAV